MSATLRRPSLLAQLALVAAALAAAAFFTFVTPARTVQLARFTPATLGDQPAGAVALAREDGTLAVGIAVAPRPGQLLLVATVFGPNGFGLAGLHGSLAVTTADGQTLSAAAAPCAAGCYEAAIPTSARPTSATFVLRHRDRVTVELPRQWPPRPALDLVHDARVAYTQLRSLVTHERLGSSPTAVVYTTYYAVAPDELRFDVRDGEQAVIIGDRRWDRSPGGSWVPSSQTPIHPITPYWTPLIQDATVIGSAVVDGRPCWVIAFADPGTPGFFRIWLDKSSHRTLELEMTAAAHFMHHAYGPFNASLSIRPPTSR